jgi:starch phosphorylase
MVAEYVRRLYVPASASAARMAADDFGAARSLAVWRDRVLAAWPQVAVLHVDSALDGNAQLGGVLTLRAVVALGPLSPDDVEVEAVYGSVDSDERLIDVETVPLKVVEHIDGTYRYEGDVSLSRTGAFGYTVRALPRNDLLAEPAELGVVASA